MIPIITFFIASAFEAPPPEECRIIKRFIEYGYAININGVSPAPIHEINRLRGLTWRFGDDELETTQCTENEIFVLIYFNESITGPQLEAARIHFSGLLGLSTFARKTRGVAKLVDSNLFEPFQRQKAIVSPDYDDTVPVDGKYITRIEGGSRSAQVDALCAELSV